MANFEGLIKQALESQNASDLSVREKVYHSSRVALSNMLDKAQALPDAAKQAQITRLEQAITDIEARYAQAASNDAPDEPLRDIASETTDETISPLTESEKRSNASSILSMLEQARQGTFEAKTPPDKHRQRGEEDEQHDQDSDSQRFAEAQSQGQTDPLVELADIISSRPTIEQSAEGLKSKTAVSWQEDDEPTPIETASEFRPVGEPEFDRPSQEPIVETELDAHISGGQAEQFSEEFGGLETAFEDGSQRFGGQEGEPTPYPVYKRKNPILRRLWPILLILGILLVILWILYAVFTNMTTSEVVSSNRNAPGPVGEKQIAEDGSATITLLEPTDLSSLVTAGRGTAELRTEQNEQILRLQSVRQSGATGRGAQPILLDLEKGVLQQIIGKIITVELVVKSGMSGPAQFAIECFYADTSICGRKRFVVGQQPEHVVFSMDLSQHNSIETTAYLALSTDITPQAARSGKGDIIDVVFARLRFTP